MCGDRAGFIANTLLFGYLNHAASMYEARFASREDIDAAMRFGCGYPMGPLALLDLIGLDTAYEILDTMYKQGRDRLHAPTPMLKQLVTAGFLGRKTGRGFYTYEDADSPVVVADAHTPSAEDKPQLVRPISRIGVVGTGTMATGIVEVFAKAGYDVTYVGRAPAKVDGGPGHHRALARQGDPARQARGVGEAGGAGRLTGTTSLDDLADADLVVEAIAEDLAVKTTLFENLDEICKPGAILATTTSSLPIISCATATKRPQDVIGMHFFNPAPIMRLVEVVSTVSTADDVRETVLALCERVGKVAVSCGDRAGFIVNALLFPYLNDAVQDARGALRDRRRHRHRDEAGLCPADGALRAPRRGRQRRVAGDPARALPGVPRARLRTRTAARAPGHRGLPGSQDAARLPRLQRLSGAGPVSTRPRALASSVAGLLDPAPHVEHSFVVLD